MGLLLAVIGSASGAARFVCRSGTRQGWNLLTSGYSLRETLRNLPKIGPDAASVWETLIQPLLQLVPDAPAMGVRALVFPKAKDCPVVITALAAEATVMLTLDRTDFHGALGREIYGLMIRTPADFLNDPRRPCHRRLPRPAQALANQGQNRHRHGDSALRRIQIETPAGDLVNTACRLRDQTTDRLHLLPGYPVSDGGWTVNQLVQEAAHGFPQVIQRMEKTVILLRTAHFRGGGKMQENRPVAGGMIRAVRQMEQPVVEEIADKPAGIRAQVDRQSWMAGTRPVQQWSGPCFQAGRATGQNAGSGWLKACIVRNPVIRFIPCGGFNAESGPAGHPGGHDPTWPDLPDGARQFLPRRRAADRQRQAMDHLSHSQFCTMKRVGNGPRGIEVIPAKRLESSQEECHFRILHARRAVSSG